MTTRVSAAVPTRPARLPETPVPPLPDVSALQGDAISTEYSHYRTGLSNHRTTLSEHRTSLSEYRTPVAGAHADVYRAHRHVVRAHPP